MNDNEDHVISAFGFGVLITIFIVALNGCVHVPPLKEPTNVPSLSPTLRCESHCDLWAIGRGWAVSAFNDSLCCCLLVAAPESVVVEPVYECRSWSDMNDLNSGPKILATTTASQALAPEQSLQ